jgi:hypothetical protein
MPGAIANEVGGIYGNTSGGRDHLWETSAALINPQSVMMSPISTMVNREQNDSMTNSMDLMGEMIAEINKMPEGAAQVDIGGKDTRPGDLASHFDPKMDQDINVYTGSGDDTVIIVE